MAKTQRGNPGLKGRLLNKSVEAYVLSLETINRLSIRYRLETFCYLICNAWELLLKAQIIVEKGNRRFIYYGKQSGKVKRTLSLRDCLKQIMPNDTDPVRRNIEQVAELRDRSAHLVVGSIPRDVMCLFQACVINYYKRLNQWFDISLADRFPAGMMSLVYDIAPNHFDMNDKVLRRTLGRDTADFLAEYCAKIRQEFSDLQHHNEFLIPIDYKLVLTKKAGAADIELTVGPTSGQHSQVILKPTDPSISHPLRQKDLVARFNAEMPESNINPYDIQCINQVHGTKRRTEFFYRGKVPGSPGQYSEAFLTGLLTCYRGNSDFFKKARAKVSATCRSSRS